MFKRFNTNYLAALFLLDAILIQVALWVAMQLRFVLPFGIRLDPAWATTYVYIPDWRLYLAVALLWVVSFMVVGVYTPRRIMRWYDEAQRILLAHSFAALSMAGLLYMAQIELARLTYVYFYITALMLFFGYRALARIWYRVNRGSNNAVARILVVGAGKVGQNLVSEFSRLRWPGLHFVGWLDDANEKQGKTILELPVLGKIDHAGEIIQRHEVDEVIIALPPHAHSRLANLVAALYEQPVRVRVVPDYFELAFFGATVESLGGMPLIGLRDPAIDGFQRFVKRLFDILASATVLILLGPIMLITAIAIKLEDQGPVLYKAPRVGENGRLFNMLKFRSMVVNADKIQLQVNQTNQDGHVIHKRADDPRVTRVGRLIRRTSVDELPQLVNVLMGDMSLVGPRPELPWLVEKYEPWQRKRFAVPQGITGWWQVNGRSDNLMHLHTDQDLYYIQNYSLWLDIQILWRTVTVVLKGRGAY